MGELNSDAARSTSELLKSELQRLDSNGGYLSTCSVDGQECPSYAQRLDSNGGYPSTANSSMSPSACMSAFAWGAVGLCVAWFFQVLVPAYSSGRAVCESGRTDVLAWTDFIPIAFVLGRAIASPGKRHIIKSALFGTFLAYVVGTTTFAKMPVLAVGLDGYLISYPSLPCLTIFICLGIGLATGLRHDGRKRV